MFHDMPRPGGTALNTLFPLDNLMQRTEINYFTPKPNNQLFLPKPQHQTLF